jgi:head-tail adaptor
MPKAGDLDHRIAWDARSVVDDGFGNTVSGPFVEQFVTYAGIKPLKGGEEVMGARLGGVQPVIITVRKSAQTDLITTDWRARDVRTGTVYAIKAPAADMEQKRAYLDILATAGEAA